MSNTLANTDLLAKLMTIDFVNELQMAAKVDRQLDTKNVFGGKNGAAIRISRPLSFLSTQTEEIVTGDIQDIEEGTITVTMDQYEKIPISLSSFELTLSVENSKVREDYITAMARELAQKVESRIAEQYKYIPNFVGTPGTPPANFLDVANARRKLSELGVPMDTGRVAFYDPEAMVSLTNGLKAVFPREIAKEAIENVSIGRYGGFEIFENQSLQLHTVGVNTGTPLIKGASQNVTYATSKNTGTQSLITDGWTVSQTGILKAGDVFTIANVYSVNMKTRQSTGALAQFVVTADADSDAAGDATFTISPPIITSGPYQTVNAAPINGAAITVLTGTGGSSYRQNMAWHKNAITLAFAQLDTPQDGVTSSRMNFKNTSLRIVRQHNIVLGKTILKLDTLFAVKVQNPLFAVRTTS